MILNLSAELFTSLSCHFIFEMPSGSELDFFVIGTLFLTQEESLNTFCRIRRDSSQFSFI